MVADIAMRVFFWKSVAGSCQYVLVGPFGQKLLAARFLAAAATLSQKNHAMSAHPSWRPITGRRNLQPYQPNTPG